MARICIYRGKDEIAWENHKRVWGNCFLDRSLLIIPDLPRSRKAFLSYIFSLQAENYADLSLTGRKQKASLEVSDEIMVTGQCLFLQLHKKSFPEVSNSCSQLELLFPKPLS